MITRALEQLFSVQYVYASPVDRHRAGVMLWSNWLVMLTTIAWLLVRPVPALVQEQPVNSLLLLALILSLVSSIFVYLEIQRGRLNRAALLFVAGLLVIGLALTVFANPEQPRISGMTIMLLAIPAVAAGLLLERPAAVLVMVILGVALLLGAAGQSQLTTAVRLIPAEMLAVDLPVVIASLVILLAASVLFVSEIRRIAEAAVKNLQQRQWLSEFGTDIGQTILTEHEILARALTVLHERFQYDFAQVFRYDDEQNQLVRTLSTGMGQQEAANRGGYSLTEMNAISESARLKQPVTAYEGSSGGGYLRPSSHYGLAVPLLHKTNLLGVLDIQLGDSPPLTPTEIETLELFARTVANGVVNAQIIEDLQRHEQEQEAVTNHLQGQLAEYLSREQRSVSSAWSSYLQGRGKTAIGFDITPGQQITPIPAHDLPDDLRRTLEQGSLHIETRGDEKIVHVPIRFRDQTLGAMAFRIPADQEVSNHQVEMAQVVSERLAIALENMRLFEQSQAQAMREQKAGQITSQLIGAKDVNALLDLAAESFNEVLGAVHTRIYLQPDLLAEPLAETQREDAAQ